MGRKPLGANSADGSAGSSLVGRPPARTARRQVQAPAATTTNTNEAKMADNVPWTNVLRITASMASGVLAVLKLVRPASRAAA
ncbi:Uncharacterised protein [Mycobacteroides abscessus subsp. abscessus]|nr:Uncharacterised protein [Mycobacteroides abscessus subsp. abscessus]